VSVRRGAQSTHGPRAAHRPVRLLTLTTLFPNARRPRHGIFVANRLRMLCATGRVQATVIAALPRFPGLYRDHAGVPAHERIAGCDVLHPRYLHWPRIGMRRQPAALARALLAQLRQPALAGHTFDVVDAHYFYPDGVAAAMVARELRLPLVISARGSDVNLIGDIPFARERMRDAAERSDALVAVSQALKDRMIALGMSAAKIRVLRNGVDLAQFVPVGRALARRRLGLREEGFLVAAVGNLVAEKGLALAVQAVAADPELHLLIVGDGPQRAALHALATRIAPGRVSFRASMPQAALGDVYSAADVLALPSLREGWPNVLLEAIACGTPVVAARVGGVPEIVGGDAPGAALATREPDAWTSALRAVIAAHGDSAAVRSYAARFTWQEVIDEQCTLYESLAGRDPCAVVPGVRPRARRTRTAHGVA
jgi:teichuronic acid biosynthesis glycosyltransferase TuaC